MSEPRLLNRMRHAIRVRQYSLSTEKAYVDWARRLILFHGKRHPGEMGKREVEAFLTHLAVTRSVSPGTQNQALAALLFLYRHVLEIELPWLDDVVRARPKRGVPVVLSREEVVLLLSRTTMIYTHVVQRGSFGVMSPLDRVAGVREPVAGAAAPVEPTGGSQRPSRR